MHIVYAPRQFAKLLLQLSLVLVSVSV